MTIKRVLQAPKVDIAAIVEIVIIESVTLMGDDHGDFEYYLWPYLLTLTALVNYKHKDINCTISSVSNYKRILLNEKICGWIKDDGDNNNMR